MASLTSTFKALRDERKKALVAYLTASDPDLETSIRAALAAVEAGADVLEIGVPFSDPIADGAVIQRAMQRALASGGGFLQALDVVRAVRKVSQVAIVLFGYVNPLLWDGMAKSCALAKDAGVDALLVVDVPPEEAKAYKETAAAHGLEWVSLVAPTSGDVRAAQIAREASGFVYLVSMTGVTGGSFAASDALKHTVRSVRDASSVPVCIGFGIKDGASARQAAALADGVVVGSALVQALEEGGRQRGPENVARLITQLREGLTAASS